MSDPLTYFSHMPRPGLGQFAAGGIAAYRAGKFVHWAGRQVYNRGVQYVQNRFEPTIQGVQQVVDQAKHKLIQQAEQRFEAVGSAASHLHGNVSALAPPALQGVAEVVGLLPDPISPPGSRGARASGAFGTYQSSGVSGGGARVKKNMVYRRRRRTLRRPSAAKRRYAKRTPSRKRYVRRVQTKKRVYRRRNRKLIIPYIRPVVKARKFKLNWKLDCYMFRCIDSIGPPEILEDSDSFRMILSINPTDYASPMIPRGIWRALGGNASKLRKQSSPTAADGAVWGTDVIAGAPVGVDYIQDFFDSYRWMSTKCDVTARLPTPAEMERLGATSNISLPPSGTTYINTSYASDKGVHGDPSKENMTGGNMTPLYVYLEDDWTVASGVATSGAITDLTVSNRELRDLPSVKKQGTLAAQGQYYAKRLRWTRKKILRGLMKYNVDMDAGPNEKNFKYLTLRTSKRYVNGPYTQQLAFVPIIETIGGAEDTTETMIGIHLTMNWTCKIMAYNNEKTEMLNEVRDDIMVVTTP